MKTKLRLTRRLERLRHLMLDWLAGIGGDLRGQSPDLARLTGEDIELAADEGRLELDNLAKGLGAGELLGEVEGRVEITLVKIDQLAIEGGRALSCGIERPLQRIDGLFQLLLAALVGLPALVDRLLGESAHALRNGRVELQCLEFLRGLAECVARLLGGGLGGIGVAHGGL